MSAITTQEQYVDALKDHDWWYGYSDDFRVFRQGAAAHAELHQAHLRFDPDWTIWNQYAPPDWQIKKP